MKKVFFILFVILLSTSCFLFNSVLPRDLEFFGASVIGYPEWVGYDSKDSNYIGCLYGYSKWIDWNSEKGQKFHRYAKGYVPSNFSGKFRLYAFNQHIYLGFNDPYFTIIYFYNFWGNFFDGIEGEINGRKTRAGWCLKNDDGSYGYEASFLQYYPNKFEYSENISEKNKAKIRFERIADSDDSFIYSICIGKDKIINERFCRLFPKATSLESLQSWFPTEFNEVVGDNFNSDKYYGTLKGKFEFSKNNLKIIIENANVPVMCSFEGISLRSIDNSTRTVSFWLEDREKSGFADYFEMVVGTEPPVGQGFDKMAYPHGCNVRRGTLTFYKLDKNGIPYVVRHFDENHTEFKTNEWIQK